MRLLAVSVGAVRPVVESRRTVQTGIFKRPVPGRVRLTRLGLEGDEQADRRVHGGPDRAAYVYTIEDYRYWEHRLGRSQLPFGQFGENLTVEGMPSDQVRIGDRYRIGEAVVEVTHPRVPCFKLGIRMGTPKMVRWFLESGRYGFYLRVLEEGTVGAGDPIELIYQDPRGITVTEVCQLRHFDNPDPERIARALEIPALPDGWKEALQERMEAGDAPTSPSLS